MVGLPVELYQICLKVRTDLLEKAFQYWKHVAFKHVVSVLCYKDQVAVKFKNTMSASSIFICFTHRPIVYSGHEEDKDTEGSSKRQTCEAA